MAFLTNLLKAIILPLLEKLGKFLFSWINDILEERRIKKNQAKKTKAIKDAKTSEESRAAHRANERI